MPRRTLSITDDDEGVRVTVRVEDDQVRAVHFDALNGHGISPQNMRLLDAFGFSDLSAELPGAPAPAAIPPPAEPEPEPQPKVVSIPKGTPSGPIQRPTRGPNKAPRFTGSRPSDAALARMYRDTGGSPMRMAEHIGCSIATVGNWLTDLRRRGIELRKSVANGQQGAIV